MDPRKDEMIETYEMYELAGTEEYNGARARLYANNANDWESKTAACPMPTDASWPDCSASTLIF